MGAKGVSGLVHWSVKKGHHMHEAVQAVEGQGRNDCMLHLRKKENEHTLAPVKTIFPDTNMSSTTLGLIMR